MILRPSNKKVFIDLHGVMSDLHTSAFAVHGVKDIDLHHSTWPECDYNIVRLCNNLRGRAGLDPITDETFWNRLSKAFWQSLPFNPWAMEFLAAVENEVGAENVVIASAAVATDAAFVGTKRWIMSHLPDYRGSYFLGPDKTCLARRDAILIDDHDWNCESFAEEGGTAILVSRPWNKGGYTVENPLVQALEDLRQLCD
jgi:5'(3')-deoxyribonucleotidase